MLVVCGSSFVVSACLARIFCKVMLPAFFVHASSQFSRGLFGNRHRVLGGKGKRKAPVWWVLGVKEQKEKSEASTGKLKNSSSPIPIPSPSSPSPQNDPDARKGFHDLINLGEAGLISSSNPGSVSFFCLDEQYFLYAVKLCGVPTNINSDRSQRVVSAGTGSFTDESEDHPQK